MALCLLGRTVVGALHSVGVISSSAAVLGLAFIRPSSEGAAGLEVCRSALRTVEALQVRQEGLLEDLCRESLRVLQAQVRGDGSAACGETISVLREQGESCGRRLGAAEAAGRGGHLREQVLCALAVSGWTTVAWLLLRSSRGRPRRRAARPGSESVTGSSSDGGGCQLVAAARARARALQG